ncbi:unnamed protein product [Zymoseptoria tritici ST99CH_1A5]|uniref:Uncharacterized protein n=1 Tax=Zymoseptoria tritici ST99CH_1A5 TaxID=1276529 RepID=A0A1Y6M1D3_ZYMTR|nr:unnamed protein product [Zymoseptoria tritici ST99CH_1A5]
MKGFAQAYKTYFDKVWNNAKPPTRRTAWFQDYRKAVPPLRPFQLWLDGEIASMSMALRTTSAGAVLRCIKLRRGISASPAANGKPFPRSERS